MQAHVDIGDTRTRVRWADGTQTWLPNLWLRDNCPCPECRVDQTSEKKFLLSAVPDTLQPSAAAIDDDDLVLTWPDGHVTRMSGIFVRALIAPDERHVELWGADFVPHEADFSAFIDSDATAAAALERFLATGALILTGMPVKSGTLERLQPRLGPIRDMPFGRLHEVRVDPSGYNVAHTALALPPHNDFASCSWPPSVQALHMLANECEGGETVIVDGWAVAGQLRADKPDLFDVLCTTPVPFRMFSDEEETFAVNPLIRVDAAGHIIHVRYSNQLMQPMNPHTPELDLFYRAYREFTCRLNDVGARAVFRLDTGHCLLVAGHRVLHAREAFEATGRRHLQDAYFEHDCARNHLTLIKRRLETSA